MNWEHFYIPVNVTGMIRVTSCLHVEEDYARRKLTTWKSVSHVEGAEGLGGCEDILTGSSDELNAESSPHL